MTAVAIVSGGLDSSTLAYWLRRGNDEPLHLVGVNYGQRHVKELQAAAVIATRVGAHFHGIDLSGLAHHLRGSALTSPEVEVPHGHYADDTMRATVVPNRNAILLSIAVGIAVAEGAEVVATGVHAGDHPIYPDCRPDFIHAFDRVARLGTAGYGLDKLRVIAPFVNMSKADIVTMGATLGVPFDLTWSCYEGDSVHCGRCGTCVERREAFTIAGVFDPTVYADLGGD